MLTDNNEQAPERPDWITSVPGIPPIIKEPVTDEEIAQAAERNTILREEAMRLWDSQGRSQMSYEQTFIAQHYSRATIHRQNLDVFQAEMRRSPAQEIVHHVIHHALALADALLHLGEFDEVITALEGIGGLHADHLRELAFAWAFADLVPDEEVCECKPLTTDEHVDERNNVIPVSLEAPLRYTEGEYFSKRLGTTARIRRCGRCGHRNGRATLSDRNVDIRQARAAAEHNVRVAGLIGRQARAHLESLNHLGDRTHLKQT